jgi:hypothetical protein
MAQRNLRSAQNPRVVAQFEGVLNLACSYLSFSWVRQVIWAEDASF